MANTDILWTVDELTARVALALAEGYEGQPSGRVRDVPDVRTVRFYTTLGLVDGPAELRGRTGLYGLRHLRQLVAIKRLQARGLPLAEVQQRLFGLTDAKLARLARLPSGLEDEPAPSASVPPDEARPNRRGGDFWREPPAAAAEEQPKREGQPEPAAPAGWDALPLQGVALGPGVTLLLAASRPVEEDDVAALRAAAAPLLKLLEARRLLGPDQERGKR